MIGDMVIALRGEVAEWDALRPLTFDGWLQRHRLIKAIRYLTAYLSDDQPDDGGTHGLGPLADDYDPDGGPR